MTHTARLKLPFSSIFQLIRPDAALVYQIAPFPAAMLLSASGLQSPHIFSHIHGKFSRSALLSLVLFAYRIPKGLPLLSSSTLCHFLSAVFAIPDRLHWMDTRVVPLRLQSTFEFALMRLLAFPESVFLEDHCLLHSQLPLQAESSYSLSTHSPVFRTNLYSNNFHIIANSKTRQLDLKNESTSLLRSPIPSNSPQRTAPRKYRLPPTPSLSNKPIRISIA